MLFESLRKSRFWLEWQRKFENNAKTVWIQPNSRAANKVAREAIRPRSTTPLQKADEIRKWIQNNIDYKLTKEWQNPNDLLASGAGDCEDFSFLITSALLNDGADEANILIGNIVAPHKENQPHVWSEIQGEVVDGTVPSNNTKPITYETVTKYKIKPESND